ncbi:MAG: lantibiotic dehydratase family protein [Paludibacteraceae bacterium]
MRYFPNNSIYKLGRKFRYIETSYENNKRRYQIAEIEQSLYLNKLLKTSTNGVTIEVLKTALISDEITEQEAIDFIEVLIDSKILIPELNQSLTGDDFLFRLIQLLEKFDLNDKTLLNKLKQIQYLLLEIEQSTSNLELYKEVIEIIKSTNIPYEEKTLFQVDIQQNKIKAFLGDDILKELESALIFLNKINLSSTNPQLDNLKNVFNNRYEGREVPLMEVLDPDIGIGYPINNNNNTVPLPLVDDLVMQGKPQVEDAYNTFQSKLFQSVLKVNDRYTDEIILTDEDVKELKENWDSSTSTIQTLFEIVTTNEGDHLLLVKAFGNISGANLLGRFTYMDKEVEQLVKDITSKEQELHPEAILAEIIHSPESRVGNILSRTHIRDYELLYLSDTDLPKEQQILLSDLMLSVRRERLFLRSKKMNKEIIPKLTTAHNHNNGNSMPVYRFLCDMQSQSYKVLSFMWSQQLQNELSFLPRVRYKNTILSSAIWRVKIEEIKHFFNIHHDEELIKSIEEWRNKRNIPKFVLMSDFDNELYVDWENPLIIRSLFSIIKKKESVKFTEFLFSSEKSIVTDSEGAVYTNEFIVPFYKNFNDETSKKGISSGK